MTRSLARAMPFALAFTWACVPLFPAFITLTSVSFPGVSLVPSWLAVALLAGMALMAIYGLLALFASPRERLPLLVPLLAWLGACALSTVFGFNPRDGAIFIAIFGLGIVWHCSLMRFYAQPNVARAVYWSYLGTGAISSVLAVVMVVARAPALQYTIGHGRAIGTFILAGELAGYLILLLPICVAIVRVAPDRALRALGWIALVAGAVAMILTFSRAGWTGLACGAAFYIAARARLRHAGVAVGAAVVVVALAIVLTFFNVHHNPSENFTRLSIWQAALGVIDRFPLTGVGPFGFSRVYAMVRLPDGDATAFHAHSVYLTIFSELGIVGFAAMAWTFFRFADELRARLATASPVAKELALAITAGVVGSLVQGLIDTVSVAIFGLWLPTLALALAAARHGLGEER